jgi:hypothetical protein
MGWYFAKRQRRRLQITLCHVGFDIFQGDVPSLSWGKIHNLEIVDDFYS